MKFSKIVIGTILISTMISGTNYAKERISLGFLYGGDNVNLVSRTGGAINQASPSCFNFDSKGNLVVSPELTHFFVNEMHKRGVSVTPFISNHWVRSKGRAVLANAEKIAIEIAEYVKEYELDGVNVDIENLTEDDRESLTEFVRLLRNAIPYGKMVTVSVAANPDASDIGWQGSYDYAKLGEYADYLFLMTYDEHSQGGPAGSISSLPFVEKAINYALQYVPKEKIVMGIPLFGRYWREDTGKGGEAIVIGAVENLLEKTKNVVQYSEVLQSPVAQITVNTAEMPIRINGVDWTDGDYIVWYENIDSIKAKLSLVNKYDLRGAGVWALGQERADFDWKEYMFALNKNADEMEALAIKEAEEKRLELIRLEQENKLIVERREYEAMQVAIIETTNKMQEEGTKLYSGTQDIKEVLDELDQSENLLKRFPHTEEMNQNKDLKEHKKEDKKLKLGFKYSGKKLKSKKESRRKLHIAMVEMI